MTDQINVLTDIDTLEVTLCKRGKNKKRWALSKSQEETMKNHEEVLKAILETPAKNEDQITELFKGLDEKALTGVTAALRMLDAYKADLPKDVMSLLAKAGEFEIPGSDDEMTDEEKAKKAKEEAEAKAKAKAAKSKPDLEGVPPEVKAQLEALWKANQEATQKAQYERDELRKTLDTERADRQRKEFIAKAEVEYKSVPGKSSEEMADVLLKAHAVSPEYGETIEATFKAANDAIEKSSLFDIQGRSGSGVTGSAWDKIEKMAAGVVQKSTDAEMTKAKATEIVLDTPEGQALYQQYLDENPKQVG